MTPLLSDQEGEDVYDLIEWAGQQAWSTGAVGTYPTSTGLIAVRPSALSVRPSPAGSIR